jgi:hypothetical protein
VKGVDTVDDRVSYEQTRTLCNEVARALGFAAFASVIVFCIYNWVTDDVELGWLWLPFIPLALLVTTMAAGLPILILNAGLSLRRPALGFGKFFALKVASAVWFFASFVLAWRVSGVIASLMS